MLGVKLIIVVLDNRGFGCINRLQQATGGAPFNNLLRDARHETLPDVDFVAHARSLGAEAVKVSSIAELETAFKAARAAKIDAGHRHRHRSAWLDRRRRLLVGRRGAGGFRAGGGRRRAPRLRGRAEVAARWRLT